MDAIERAEIVRRLEESRDVLLAAVEGISDQEAAVRRTPERWSVAECVEHVAVVERRMLAMIRRHFTLLDAPVETREREGKLLHVGSSRKRRFEAPPSAQPTGSKLLSAALQDFMEARRASLAYISQTTDDLRARTVEHPVAGTITAQECLMLLVAHPARHAEQIREEIRGRSTQSPISREEAAGSSR
jgi:uncharacterized damage-inducible protein DinB